MAPGLRPYRRSEGLLSCGNRARKRADHTSNVALVIYDSLGARMSEIPIMLQANETQRLTLVALQARVSRRDVGGIQVRYFGMSMEVVGQISLGDPRYDGTVDVPMYEDMEFMSNTRDAVWWEAVYSDSILIIGNSSENGLSVNLKTDMEEDNFKLHPHETRRVRLTPELGSGSVRAVHLSSDGMPGQLRAAGFTRDLKTSSLDTIRYSDPAYATGNELFANGLPFGSNGYHLSVHNLIDTPVRISGELFAAVDGRGHTIHLVPLTLAPGESREARVNSSNQDLRIWQGGTLRLSSTGGRGSFIVAFTALTAAGLYESVPFKDLGRQESSTGGYPWRLDGDYQSRIFISNTSDAPAVFVAQIIVSDIAPYIIGRRTIAPHATQIFDIRKLRDMQIKDERGATIPRSANQGQFIWGLESHRTDSSGLIGRNEVRSDKQLSVANLSCFSCTCGYGMSYITQDGPPNSMNSGQIVNVNTWGEETSPCNQNNAYRVAVTPDWTFGTPGILSALAGQPSQVTGHAGGTTQWTTTVNGSNVTFNQGSCITTNQYDTDSGSTQVGSAVPVNFRVASSSRAC